MSPTLNVLSSMICFMLPLNATKAEAEGVIDRISDLFKLEGDGGISATDAVSVAVIPQATLPGMTATTDPTPPAASDLDIEGLPWDARIHSSTKNKNEDGTWRIKRGTDKSLVTRIKNQLRATAAATAPAVATAAPPAPPAALPTPPIAGLPPLPGANVNPAYTEFVQFIAANSPPFTPEYVIAGLSGFGIAEGSMQNLAHRPDLIPSIRAAFAAAISK